MSISRQGFFAALLSACCVAGAISAHADQTFDFNTPVVTGNTQAPGVWYTDRYAPAGFSSPDFFDGDNRLLHSISAADSADNRPGSFSAAFYNTQGRKYDLEAGTRKMSIDLYIPAAWASTDARMAGFWGTGVDGADVVTAYPIIEFTSDGGAPRFRGYETGGDGLGLWVDMGLPSGFAYDSWQTLEIAKLNTGEFKYSVGDLVSTTTTMGPDSAELANVILQGHNSTTGVSYDIHWDNLSTSVVPEPASLALAGAGLLGLIAVRRRASRA